MWCKVIKTYLIFFISLLFIFPATIVAQITGYVEDFNDNILTGWVVEEEHQRTYTLSEEDSVLKIDYHRVVDSWEWDNFNHTPLPIDVSNHPNLSIMARSTIPTVLTIKPDYESGADDWLQVSLPPDNQWHEYYFTLTKVDSGNLITFYMYLDGGSTEPATGLVWLDELRVGDQARFKADFSELDLALYYAQELLDNSAEGMDEGQYIPGSKSELEFVISQSEALYDLPGVSQNTVDQAVLDLYDACMTYETKANVADIHILDTPHH